MNTMSTPSTALILAMDVEPTPHHAVTGAREEWDGFLACVELLGEQRRRIMENTGRPLRVTWCLRMDEQVRRAYGSISWAAETFADVIRELEALGDEFGIHNHAYRQDPEGNWFEDFTDSKAIGRDLNEAAAAFKETIGYRPTVFSFGACWLDQLTVRALEKAGFAFVLSIPPGRSASPALPPDIGTYPDFRSVPREPYHPDQRDFRRRGRWPFARKLWMMPVASSCAFHPGEWHPTDGKGHLAEQLNIGMHPSFVQPVLDVLLNRQAGVIVAVGRTGDVSVPEVGADFRANLEYLCSHPAISRIAIEPPSAAIEHYAQQRRGGILRRFLAPA